MTNQQWIEKRYELVCAMSVEMRKAQKLVKKGKINSIYTAEYNRLLTLHHEADSQIVRSA
jgi:hypothetical protein